MGLSFTILEQHSQLLFVMAPIRQLLFYPSLPQMSQSQFELLLICVFIYLIITISIALNALIVLVILIHVFFFILFILSIDSVFFNLLFLFIQPVSIFIFVLSSFLDCKILLGYRHSLSFCCFNFIIIIFFIIQIQ